MRFIATVFLLLLISLAYSAEINSKKSDPMLWGNYLQYKQKGVDTYQPVYIEAQHNRGEVLIPVLILSTLTDDELRQARIESRSRAKAIVQATISFSQYEWLLQQNKVRYIEPSVPVESYLGTSTGGSVSNGASGKIFIGNWADAIQEGSPSYQGTGVIVGAIDPTGMNFHHEDFYHDSLTRVVYLWDQSTGTGGSTHPSGYGYGTEWTAAQINAGSCTQTASSAHGTHCMGILAGGGNADSLKKGMAPASDIIFIKGNSSFSSYIQDGVAYMFNKATALGKPAVMSLSLGSQQGPHDGTSLRVQAIDALCDSLHHVVFAVGNSGGSNIHANQNVIAGMSHTFQVTVTANDLGVDMWYGGNNNYNVFITPPGGSELSVVAPGSSREDVTSYGRIQVYNDTDSPTNGKNHLIVYATKNGTSFTTGTWSIRVSGITVVDSGRIDGWCFGNGAFTSGCGGNTAMTVTDLATGQQTIAVGAYNGGSQYGDGAIYSVSSYGPTADNRLKPELVAAHGVSAPSYNANDTYSTTGGGTSFAAPHVAGAIALMLQKWGTLSPTTVRNRLEQAAMWDAKMALTGSRPSAKAGYGKLNTFVSMYDSISVSPEVILSREGTNTRLDWSTIVGATGYIVERNSRLSDDGWTELTSSAQEAIFYEDSDSLRSYYYRVKAVHQTGQ